MSSTARLRNPLIVLEGLEWGRPAPNTEKRSRSLASRRGRRQKERAKEVSRAQGQMVVDHLRRLTHRRWAIPILAEFHAAGSAAGKPAYIGGGGAKFVTLATRLGISRASLTDTLEYLLHHDYLMRNPGYGHPMRPEYLLADDGHAMVEPCAALMAFLRARKIERVMLGKWSLQTLLAIADGLDRFNRIKACLKPVTARALTQTLKDLVEAGVVRRMVTSTYPPETRYVTTSVGRQILRTMSTASIRVQ